MSVIGSQLPKDLNLTNLVVSNNLLSKKRLEVCGRLTANQILAGEVVADEVTVENVFFGPGGSMIDDGCASFPQGVCVENIFGLSPINTRDLLIIQNGLQIPAGAVMGYVLGSLDANGTAGWIPDPGLGMVNTLSPIQGDGTLGNEVTFVGGTLAGNIWGWNGASWVQANLSVTAPISGNGISTPLALAPAPLAGDILEWSGAAWLPVTPSGGGTGAIHAVAVYNPADTLVTANPANPVLLRSGNATAFALGQNAINLTSAGTVAIGPNIVEADVNSVVIGSGARTQFTGNNSVVVGQGALSSSLGGVAIGQGAQAQIEAGGIAIGDGALAPNGGGSGLTRGPIICIGPNAQGTVGSGGAIGIGRNVRPFGDGCILIGDNTTTNNNQTSAAIVIGRGAQTNGAGANAHIVIGGGTDPTTQGARVLCGNGGIRDIAIGVDTFISGTSSRTIAMGFGALAPSSDDCVILGTAASVSGANSAVSIGPNSSVTGTGSVAIGNGTTSAATNNVVVGAGASSGAGTDGAVVIGNSASASSFDDGAVVIGRNANSFASGEIIIGNGAQGASGGAGSDAIIVGNGAASNSPMILIGPNITATNCTQSTIIGPEITITGATCIRNIIIGSATIAAGGGNTEHNVFVSPINSTISSGIDRCVLIGPNTTMQASEGVAIGDNASVGATFTSAVALGANSTATVANKLFCLQAVSPVSAASTPIEVTAAGEIGPIMSAAKYKKHIEDLPDLSDAFDQLRPVSFEFKTDSTLSYGLIADEVADIKELEPVLVVRNPTGDVETVRYNLVAPILIQQVQNLKMENASLKLELELAKADLVAIKQHLGLE